MVKIVYRLNRKKMYLDPKVYHKAVEMNINWNDINAEVQRLQRIGHPNATYNTAAIFAIDKRCQETMNMKAGKVSSPAYFGAPAGKKGFVGDSISLMISLAILMSMLILLAAYIETQNASIQASESDAIFKSTFNTSLSGFNAAADVGFIVGIVILIGFLLYSAYAIGTNPALFIIALLLNVCSLFILPVLEDYLISSWYNNSYATAAASMPALFHILNNYTVFITGITVLTFIALLVRPRGEV